MAAPSALLAVGLTFAVSCSAKHDPPPGAIFLAIDANLKVPTDIDEIGVSVACADGSVVTTDMIHPMAPAGDARFPATLAILRGTDQPIDIKVAGFKNGVAFALREAVTTIPADRTALLRMDLNYLDVGSTSGAVTKVQSLSTAPPCTSTQTSIAGSCQSFMLESLSLPTYSEGDVVSSTSEACFGVTSCFLGAAAGSTAIPRPTADPNDPTSCTIPVPSLGTSFNLGIVPADGATGWCDASGCVVPLVANDATEGWAIGMDGVVHLPASICADTKVASLVLIPATTTCPLYGPAHPACQQYGDGSEAGTDGGNGGDATTVKFQSVEQGVGFGTALGLAVDPASGNAYAFLEEQDDVTTEYVYAGFVTPDLGTGATDAGVAAFSPVSSQFAVTSDRLAATSASGVQTFLLAGGSDAGFFTNPNGAESSIAYQQSDAGSQLLASGIGLGLQRIAPDGGQSTLLGGAPVSIFAYDGASHVIVVDNTSKPTTLTYDALEDPTSAAPFASGEGNTVSRVVFADPQTAVWVDEAGNFYVSLVTASGAGGTLIPMTTGIVGGVGALSGANGRIVWIGADSHVYTMHVGNGVAAGTYFDLADYVRVAPDGTTTNPFTNATQVSLDPAQGLVLAMQDLSVRTSDIGQYVVAAKISDLP